MSANDRMREAVKIRADLLRVAREMGRPEGVGPAIVEYRAHGRFTTSRVAKMAGLPEIRWVPALRFYGLSCAYIRRRATTRELIADLHRVAALLGLGDTMPNWRQYEKHGRFSRTAVEDHLSEGRGWTGAATRAGLKPQGPARGKLKRDITREMVLEDYRRVAGLLGYSTGGPGPTVAEYREHGKHGTRALEIRFGTWRTAVEAAGFCLRPSYAKRSDNARRLAAA